jgi:protein-S-isoprenylcysteine O-methyltransferase Ste14
MLAWLAAPLALGSLWALLPAALTALALVIRTILEDRMLHADLPGYVEYAQQTRARLLPGVW